MRVCLWLVVIVFSIYGFGYYNVLCWVCLLFVLWYGWWLLICGFGCGFGCWCLVVVLCCCVVLLCWWVFVLTVSRYKMFALIVMVLLGLIGVYFVIGWFCWCLFVFLCICCWVLVVLF